MMSLKKWTGLLFVLICPGLVFAGLGELSASAVESSRPRLALTSPLVFSSGYSYSFRNGAFGISDGSDFDAVRSAFETWTGQPGLSLRAVEIDQKGKFVPGRMNYQNDISWIGPTAGDPNPWKHALNLPDEMLAVVMVWTEPRTHCVLERDLYFNDVTICWRTESDGAEIGGYFVEHIALHEIGHLFGLPDVYDPGQPGWEEWMGSENRALTMYGYSSWQDETVVLHPADVAAMALLHSAGTPEPGSFGLWGLAAGLFWVISRR